MAACRAYVLDFVIETTISGDILLVARIDKPALLPRLCHLACEYAGRELTFEKMTGGPDRGAPEISPLRPGRGVPVAGAYAICSSEN